MPWVIAKTTSNRRRAQASNASGRSRRSTVGRTLGAVAGRSASATGQTGGETCLVRRYPFDRRFGQAGHGHGTRFQLLGRVIPFRRDRMRQGFAGNHQWQFARRAQGLAIKFDAQSPSAATAFASFQNRFTGGPSAVSAAAGRSARRTVQPQPAARRAAASLPGGHSRLPKFRPIRTKPPPTPVPP